MKAIVVATCAAAAAAVLTGCSSSTSGHASGPPTAPTSIVSTPNAGPGHGSTEAPPVPPGSGPAADNGAYPNPCTLITDADAQTLLGAALKTRGVHAADPAAHGGSCTWDTGANVLYVNDGDPTVLGALAKQMGRPMSGLGDEAYSSNGMVYFRKGDVGVRVMAGGRPKDAIVTLARTVLSHL